MLNLLLRANDRWVPREHRARLREMYEATEYRWTRLRTGRDVFSAIEIETNTGCNRKCRICPRHKHEREAGFMADDLYRNLLDQLAEIDFRGRFSPVFYNEPLLDDRLIRLMAEAKAKLPRAQIVLFTNGSLLTSENLEALADAGVGTFIVSLYERNLRADERPATAAIRGASARTRRKVRYRVLGEEDYLSTSGGLVPVRNAVTKSRCLQASLACVVDYRGNVVLCCNDYYTEHVFGNVATQNILDIWGQPRFQQLRKELRDGRFELDICKACASGTLQAPSTQAPQPG